MNKARWNLLLDGVMGLVMLAEGVSGFVLGWCCRMSEATAEDAVWRSPGSLFLNAPRG